jgi:SlyX protein
MESQLVERLESKIAFLERANNELSDVVYRQHREIQALRARLDALAERFDSITTADEQRTPEDERPPHY